MVNVNQRPRDNVTLALINELLANLLRFCYKNSFGEFKIVNLLL